MAASQSRIRLACAQMALISLIFVTPMATSSSGLLGKLPDFIAEQKLRRAALSGRFFRSGGRRRPPVSLAQLSQLGDLTAFKPAETAGFGQKVSTTRG